MEDAKARLGKFLAKERSLRDGGEDESIMKISEERNLSVVSRAAMPISSIISSPDTFEETKRRVSRVKGSPVKDNVRKPLSPPAKVRQVTSRHTNNTSPEDTPIRSRKRLVIKSPALDNRAIIKQNPRISRSLSPMPLRRSQARQFASLIKQPDNGSSADEEDDVESTLSLPFPQLTETNKRELNMPSSSGSTSALKPKNTNNRKKGTTPDHMMAPDTFSELSDPSVNARLCSSVVDDIILWEASLDNIDSHVDMIKKLRIAETIMKRIGVDRIIWLKKNAQNSCFSLVEDEKVNIPTKSLETALLSNGHINFSIINAEDDKFDVLSKLLQLNDSFEAKVMQNNHRYLLIATSSSHDMTDMVAVFYVESNINVPFHPFSGRFGEAFRSMVSSETKLLSMKIWEAVRRTTTRLQHVEMASRIRSERNELSQKGFSRDSLLTFSLWSASSEFNILSLATAISKTASVFSRSCCVLFFRKRQQAGEYQVAKFVAGDGPPHMTYENLTEHSPFPSCLFPDGSKSQTLAVDVTGNGAQWLLRHDHTDKVHHGDGIWIKSSFSAIIDSQVITCIIFVPVSPTIDHIMQMSHASDLRLIAETAFSNGISKAKTKFLSMWSEAATLLKDSLVSSPKSDSIENIEKDDILNNIFGLIDCVESAKFCAALGIRKATVLLDLQLSKTLGCTNLHTSNDYLRENTFVQRSSMGLKYISVSSLSNQWLKDLASGKVVLFHPCSASLNGLCIADGDSSQLELLKFILSIDAEAHSTMLIPINSSVGNGMGIMVLFDKVSDLHTFGWSGENTSECSHKRYDVAFDSNFFDQFQKLGIVSFLLNYLNRFHYQKLMIDERAVLNVHRHELLDENSFLTEAVYKLFERRLLNKIFASWKQLFYQKKIEDELKNKDFLVEFAMSMIKFRQVAPKLSPSQSTTHFQAKKSLFKAYLVHFESWLRKVFPTDTVLVDPEQLVLDSLRDNDTISNAIIDTSSSCFSFDKSQNTAKVLASVLISRPTLSGRFSQEDLKWFEDLCSMGSEIYSCLLQGFQVDAIDGDVRSLTLPMLKSMIVPLADCFTSSSQSNYEHLIQRMCIWVKKLCGAELVMTNISGDFFLDGTKESSVGWVTESSDATKEVNEWVVKAWQEIEKIAFVLSADVEFGVGSEYVAQNTGNVHTIRLGLPSSKSVGDMKIVMPAGVNLSDDHFQVVQTLLYLFFSLILAKNNQATASAESQNFLAESRKVGVALASVNEELQMQKLQYQCLLYESTICTKSIKLALAIKSCKNIYSIAACMWELIPDLVKCESALFAICSNFVEVVEPLEVNDNFVILSPRTGVVEEIDRVPVRQLLMLPEYFDEGHDSQCIQSAIHLFIPGSRKIFASVILFHHKNNGSHPNIEKNYTVSPDNTVRDMVGAFLSEMVYSSIRLFFLSTEKVQLDQELKSLEDRVRERDKRLEQLPAISENLLHCRHQVESLEAVIASLKNKLLEVEFQRDHLSTELRENENSSRLVFEDAQLKSNTKIIDLERKIVNVNDLLSAEKEYTKEALLLTQKFAYDPRCSGHEVFCWLEDIAHSKQTRVYQMPIGGETEKCTSLPDKLQFIPNLWSAIGEATRTGESVCFTCHPDSYKSLVAAGSRADRYLESNDFEPVEVLCIPNRSIPVKDIGSCFIFTKSKSDHWHSFTEADKCFLEMAVNMSSRLMLKTSCEIQAEKFYRLEEELRSTRFDSNKIFHSIDLIRDIFGTSKIQSTVDLIQLIKKSVSAALADPLKTFIDIDCQVVFHDQSESKYFKYFSHKTIDMIKEVKSRKTVVTNGAMVIVPFQSVQQIFAGFMVIEKRLHPVPTSNFERLAESVSISLADQQILSVLSAFASFVMDKIDCVKEAFVSIQEAGAAISLIQEAKSAVEEKLTMEISARAEFEHALSAGGDMLSIASSQRNSIGQMIDLLRQQVITVTNSMDAHVILPYSADNILSEILLENGDVDILVRSFPSEQNHEFFTLLPDNPIPSPIRFEVGDIELQAINNFRTIYLPSANDSDKTTNWRSWVIRRLDASNRLGGTEERNIDVTSSFVMAVPFYLRSTSTDTLSYTVSQSEDGIELGLQGKIALVVVVRPCNLFSEIDRLCINWLTKVFSFCIGMRGGELNAKQNMRYLKQLQTEFYRLQNVDHKYLDLQSDISMVTKSLENNPHWNGNLETLVDHSDQNLVIMMNQIILSNCGLSNPTMDKSLLVKLSEGTLNNFEEQIFITAMEKVFFGERLRFEECTSHAWSDFYVAHIIEASKDVVDAKILNIYEVMHSKGGLIREGHLASNIKYTIKFGFLSLKNRDKISLSREEIWFSPNSKIPQAMCKLEVLGKPNQYFLVSKVNNDDSEDHSSGTEIQSDIDMPKDVSVVGFNLMNLDLKLQLAEKIVNLHCLWKLQVTKYAGEISRLHDEVNKERDLSRNLLLEKDKNHFAMESQLIKTMEAEREKSNTLFQRSQNNQRMLEAIQNECAIISNYVFSLSSAAGSLDSYSELLSRIATTAFYDFATGSYCTTEETTGKKNSISNVLWSRNEKNLQLPLISLCSNIDDSITISKLPSLAFRIIVFINAIHGDQSAASVKLKQELMDFHNRCLELSDKLSFSMELLIIPVSGEDIETESEEWGLRSHHMIAPGTILLESGLPVTVRGINHTSSFILFQPQEDHEFVSKATIKCLFRGLHQFAINSYLKYIHDKNVNQIITHRRLHGINKLQGLQIKLKLEGYRRMASFHALKSKILERRTTECSELKVKCFNFKHRSMLLDQQVADWSEMAKGLNGASQAMTGGMASFWARSCHSLLSVLSSRCTVTVCGLIYQQNGQREPNSLVELIVRNMSSPMILKQHKRNQHHEKVSNDDFTIDDDIDNYLEYAHATLERRPVQELGHRLTMQLLEIFGSSPYPMAYHSIQRLYKIAPSEENDIITYLIPVRTSVSVVAAIRVTIENLRGDEKDSSKPSLYEDILISKSDVMSAVESNLVNFADLVAPTLSAASELHQKNERLRSISDKLGIKDHEHNQISKHLSVLRNLFERFQDGVRICSASLEEIFCIERRDSVGSSLDAMIEQSCSIFTSVIGDVFDAEAEIMIDKSALVGSLPLSKNTDVPNEKLQSGRGSNFEEIDEFSSRFLLSSAPRFKSKVNDQINKNQEEITLLREGICDTMGRNFGELRISLQNGSIGMDSVNELWRFVLKPIACFIALIIVQVLNNNNLQKIIEEKDSNYSKLGHDYEDEVDRRKIYEEETMKYCKSLGIQGKWTKLSNHCLEYITSPNYHHIRFPSGLNNLVKDYSLNDALTSSTNNSLVSFLHSLIENTLSLLGKNQYGLNLAILDGKTEPGELRKLIWIHGGQSKIDEKHDYSKTANGDLESQGNLTWKELNENTQAIAINMTHLCLSTKQQSDIDVRQETDARRYSRHQFHGRSLSDIKPGTDSVVHISVVPLFYSYSSKENEEVIGALQILSFLDDEEECDVHDQSSISNFHIGRGFNRDILLDLTSLLSRLLSFEIVQTVHSHHCLSLEANLVTVQLKQQEEVNLHSYYQHMAKNWQMITYLLRDLQQNFDNSIRQRKLSPSTETKALKEPSIDDLVSIFNFESSRKYLLELGMMIKVKFGSSGEAMDSLTKFEIENSSITTGNKVIAKTVLPLFASPTNIKVDTMIDESENAYLEIILLDVYAQDSALSHGKVDMLSNSYEFVEITANTIRSLITQYHRLQGLALESTKSLDLLQHELHKQRARSTRYHQELTQHRSMLSSKQIDSVQLFDDVADFSNKILALVNFPSIPNSSLFLQTGIQEVSKFNNENMDVALFSKQAIKCLQSSFDHFVKSLQITPEKNLFSFHCSLLWRKQSLTRLQRRASFEEDKLSEEVEFMKLIMFEPSLNASGISSQGTELLLIKQSRMAKDVGVREQHKSSKDHSPNLAAPSALERIFWNNEKVCIAKDLHEIHPTDLIGILDPIYFNEGKTSNHSNKKYLVYCIGLQFPINSAEGVESPYYDAVLRLIIAVSNNLEVDVINKKTIPTHENLKKCYNSIAECLLQSLIASGQLPNEFVFMVENSVRNYCTTQHWRQRFDQMVKGEKEKEKVQIIEFSQNQLNRYKKLYKIVLRECSSLLDPPLIGIGSGVVRPVHPASLAPLAASQDTCMKILNLLRSLLRTEGQALLLKDVTTVPHTYQIIYSGDALSWPGIEQNTFGVVTSHHHDHGATYSNNATLRVSLVETVVSTKKTVLSSNVPVDDRYVSQIDGICCLGTPAIFVPLRGRGGIAVGVLVGAKAKASAEFTPEDVTAAELVASMGALSLYWCQGLGSVHHTLHKTIHKMDKLERIIQKRGSQEK